MANKLVIDFYADGKLYASRFTESFVPSVGDEIIFINPERFQVAHRTLYYGVVSDTPKVLIYLKPVSASISTK